MEISCTYVGLPRSTKLFYLIESLELCDNLISVNDAKTITIILAIIFSLKLSFKLI